MSEQLRCGICRYTMPVSEEDPDSSVDDMVQHVARTHGYDPRLSYPETVILETADVEIRRQP